MPTTETDPGRVIIAGENSFIRLSQDAGETFHEPRAGVPLSALLLWYRGPDAGYDALVIV